MRRRLSHLRSYVSAGDLPKNWKEKNYQLGNWRELKFDETQPRRNSNCVYHLSSGLFYLYFTFLLKQCCFCCCCWSRDRHDSVTRMWPSCRMANDRHDLVSGEEGALWVFYARVSCTHYSRVTGSVELVLSVCVYECFVSCWKTTRFWFALYVLFLICQKVYNSFRFVCRF